jgi:hypothetical protein
MIIVEYLLLAWSNRQIDYDFRPRKLKYLPTPDQMYALFCPQQKEHPNIPTPLSLFDCCIDTRAECMIIVVFLSLA